MPLGRVLFDPVEIEGVVALRIFVMIPWNSRVRNGVAILEIVLVFFGVSLGFMKVVHVHVFKIFEVL